ncbi:unnamed protein product [Arctia plantaginis]|uniref:RNA-directed RNA polymerase n=1 Tax=Arctia plantaginis TaxID=874455 RepID=A0A8S1AWT8_ARCPL|nr:unnamed protein product [Arctia plantaginis]
MHLDTLKCDSSRSQRFITTRQVARRRTGCLGPTVMSPMPHMRSPNASRPMTKVVFITTIMRLPLLWVDINTLRGDVDDWLTVTKHNGERINEAKYVEDIMDETVKFMSEEFTMPEKLPTMEQWVASGVWMRGKAGTGRNTLIRVEGKEKRTRRYKGVDAALKSDREIEHELREARRENMKIMQTSEGGKVRPVVVGGNELYRKMDFLSGLVEVGLYGSRTSTLFAGAAGNEAIDREWLAKVRNGCTLKVPLDQSSFDNNQSKSTILAVLLGMEHHTMGHAGVPDEYREVWGRMWDTFTTAGVEVIMGNDHRTWENGVPSGWRWTALIDTILNIVSFRVAIRYCLQYYGVAVPVGKCTMQGDDVIFTTVSVRAVEALLTMYLTLGYKMYIKDAVQAGIDERTASAFALTDATYGGAGLEIHEGHMGNYLIKTYGNRQPWIRPRIQKPPLKVRPTLGRWKERLENLDIDFTGGYREQFSKLLAITWGLREADITGKV